MPLHCENRFVLVFDAFSGFVVSVNEPCIPTEFSLEILCLLRNRDFE